MAPAETKSRTAPFWLIYSLPVATTIVATLLRLALSHTAGSAAPFVTYFAATILLAWFCGLGPAALSVVLSILAGTHYIFGAGVRSFSQWPASERTAVIGFFILSLLVSSLIDFQRRVLERAKAAEKAQSTVAEENAHLLQRAQRTQEELRRSNEELRRANRDLEVFAYSASHDLQEPVRTITLSAELIERNWNSQPREEEAPFLAQILSSSRRMQSLIADLLAYAQAATHEVAPPPGVDAGQVLTHVLESLGGLIEESGAAITTGKLPVLPIHESHLAQVFQNLIGNAIKYRSAETPRIRVSAKSQDQGWVLSVIDNGIGVEPEYAEQIFGLFKRLHGHDAYPGNGIGLTLCQRMIERYGGRVWLERSEVGKGSTFCFSVPSEPPARAG